MSDAKPVNLSTAGPPTTVLDPEPAEAITALDAALAEPDADRRAAVASVAARWPRCLVAWASLGDLGRDEVESYAYYRVGYHRGLDRLRANGGGEPGTSGGQARRTTGSCGRCRAWPTAATIGEDDEAERCAHFLAQCDPDEARGR